MNTVPTTITAISPANVPARAEVTEPPPPPAGTAGAAARDPAAGQLVVPVARGGPVQVGAGPPADDPGLAANSPLHPHPVTAGDHHRRVRRTLRQARLDDEAGLGPRRGRAVHRGHPDRDGAPTTQPRTVRNFVHSACTRCAKPPWPSRAGAGER